MAVAVVVVEAEDVKRPRTRCHSSLLISFKKQQIYVVCYIAWFMRPQYSTSLCCSMSDDPKPGPSKETPDGAAGGGEVSTLKAFMSLPENKDANYVIPLAWCPHLQEIKDFNTNEEDLAKTKLDSPCASCKHVGENWLCLTCSAVLCSRYVNEHMLFHSLETEHRMCLSFSDLSVWCYSCESYVDNDQLYHVKNHFHVEKFNEQMPRVISSTVVELKS